MAQGKFIAIYGVNNIGKSTQAKKLVEKLQQVGYDAVLLKYPIYDLPPTGPELNKILRLDQKQTVTEDVLQTLFMENRLEFEPQLKLMLKAGKIVVAEDYTGTGIAWGAAKGLDQAWVEKINKNLLQEDFALLLRGKRYLEAKELNHIHEQDDQLVQKVDAILMGLAKKKGWKVVESTEGIDETAEKIWKVVEVLLAEEV